MYTLAEKFYDARGEEEGNRRGGVSVRDAKIRKHLGAMHPSRMQIADVTLLRRSLSLSLSLSFAGGLRSFVRRDEGGLNDRFPFPRRNPSVEGVHERVATR